MERSAAASDGMARVRAKQYDCRQDWFEGLTTTLEEDGSTLLSGAVVDQPALHGILKKIRDLGMPLLSVNAVDLNQVTRADANKGKGDL